MIRIDLLEPEVVERSHGDGKSGIDGNGSGERASVIKIRDEDHRICNRRKRSFDCLPKEVTHVPRSPLLHSDQAGKWRTLR